MFNPLSPDFIRDPYPFYAQLRAADPMYMTPLKAYLASHNADVAMILRDRRFGKDFTGRTVARYGPSIMEEPVFRSMSHWMLTQDPPDHTRLRGLVVKAFTARRIEDMRPRIQSIVDDLIDRVEKNGRMDLIEDFAFRLPVIVICDMLGIPEEDREIFFHRERTGGRLLDPVPLSRAEIDEANQGHQNSLLYFQRLFELRRRQPGDDLTTQLVQAEEDGNKLTNEELCGNIILLFGAGHETTVNLIGNGLLALHRNPDQLALLKSKPELMQNAIEEFLRYDLSVQITGRSALEDIGVIGGKEIKKGDAVMCLLGLGQPRSGRLSRQSGQARHHPAEHPRSFVRRRHPLLPRRATRPHRGRDRHLDPAAAPAEPEDRRRRQPGMAPHLRPARPEDRCRRAGSRES